MVLRALSVYPEDRYLSVRAFTNALLSTLPPQPQSSLRTELETRTVLENQPVSEPEAPLQSELSPVEQLAGAEVQLSESLMQDEQVAVSARFIIISPYTGEPYEVELQDDETTIGRAGSSDILLDRDDLTSRHHALLKRENGRYVIYDRRSANGVQVNGQQLKGDSGFELIDGDHISIGNYELIFRLGMPEVTGEERSLTLNSTAP